MLQILIARLVQVAFATIPNVHAIAQYPLMDIEGGNDGTVEGIPLGPCNVLDHNYLLDT